MSDPPVGGARFNISGESDGSAEEALQGLVDQAEEVANAIEGKIGESLDALVKKYQKIAEGGGPLFGGEAFEIPGFKKIFDDLQRLEGEARNIEQFFFKRQEVVPPNMQAWLDEIRGAAQTAREELGEIQPTEVPVPDGIERTTQAFGRAQVEAADFNRTVNAGVPIVSKSDREVQKYGNTQLKAAREMQKAEEQQRKLNLAMKGIPGDQIVDDISRVEAEIKKTERAFPQLRKGIEEGVRPEALARYRALREELSKLRPAVTQADEAADNFSNATEKAGESAGFFSGILDKVKQGLESTGISISDIAIILGAGLAQGVAGAIQILRDIGGSVAEFLGELHTAERQARLTFGSAGQSIVDFADTADASLGRTRSELLQTAAAFGQLGRAINLPEESLADFAEILTTVTSELERRRGGFDSLEDATGVLEQAIRGSDDALRQFGIDMEEFRLVAEDAFDKLPDQLTQAERAFASIRAAANEATQAIINDGQKTENVLQQIGRGVTALGAATLDFVSDDQREIFERFLTSIQQLSEDGAASAFVAAEELKNLSLAQLEVLRTSSAGVEGADKITAAIDAEIAKRKELAALIDESVEKYLSSFDAQKLNEEAFLANAAAIQQVADSFRSLDRAREDGLRSIAEAQLELQRTIEDNLLREQDLRIEIARDAEDTARDVIRAEEDLVDAQIESAFQREEARRREEEARIQGARRIRDAEEKLEDFERNSARRIEDLRLRVKRTRQNQVKDLIEALIGVTSAQRQGDAEAEASARRNLARLQGDRSAQDSLADAEKELARAEEDRIREREKLERDLKETREDTERAIKDAVRDRAKAEVEAAKRIRDAQRQVEDAYRDQQRAAEDAIRELHKLEIEQNRALRDAMKSITDAEREMERAVSDANRQLERLALTLGITVNRLKELVEQYERSQELQSLGHLFAGGIPGLQHGGIARAGGAYWVGEAGPELFFPGQTGYMVSNQKLYEAIMEFLGNKGRITRRGWSDGNTFNIYDSPDPRLTAFTVSRMLAQGVS